VAPEWIVLAALTLLTGSFTVKVPSVGARISVSEAFVFTSALLFGPEVATLMVALDSFVMSLWLRPTSRTSLKSLFNLSAVALAIWISSRAFYAIVQEPPGSAGFLSLDKLAIPLFVLASLYFLLNSWLVALALAFERRAKVYELWWNNFPWLSLNYFGGASVAALLVSYTRSVDLKAVGMILPLLVISYLTYRTSLGRVEDAKRHVEQVNALYMSTIETLAMAVDAKDQITHGHIRRVQVYATELAKRLGVFDERQLQAIEAAALLHDMGKLAIPEHILNKPGKLTAAEFDKMKRHADIGADLLSSIRFPYPVVPIVRHHHENWNGTGYPNGISGTDIPLGARILSVVDCFDALTSDRPYRPRLTPEDAFQILRERRGTMYDPLVVDAFVAAYAEIAPEAVAAGQQARTLVPSQGPDDTVDSASTTSLNAIRANAAEASLLNDATRALPQTRSVEELVEMIGQYLRQLCPVTVCAVFTHSADADSYTCVHASGDPDGLLTGLSIRGGERITGWAGANDRTISNSDASLDLGNAAQLFRPRLKSAMSTSLRARTGLIGAITVYSPKSEAFLDSHRYSLEHLAAPIAKQLTILRDSEGSTSNAVVRFKDVKRRVANALS
jgi:putative nucleotidyltransferase with HDIG domain